MITVKHQLELRHFNYFRAVAEELHFRKAAEKLFISQPGLSRQIKQMEEILGTPLFVRDKKKVSLTAAGAHLQKELDLLFSQLERIKEETYRIGKGKKGELRIGFVGSAMQNVIPELLVRIKHTLPELKIKLEEMSNTAQVQAILNDQLDIGFVRLVTVPPQLQIQTVLKDSFSVVLPKSHALNKSNFKSVQQLKEENFILFSSDYSPLYYNKIVSICEDQGFLPTISHESVHAHTIFKLVENGLGVSIVPTSLQKGFDLEVKFLEIPKIRQEAVLSVIWKKKYLNPTLTHVSKLWKTI